MLHKTTYQQRYSAIVALLRYMSWTLGSLTLPNPKGLSRRYVQKDTYHEAINGKSKRDISSRKEQFTLSWSKISQATVLEIMGQYNLMQTLLFTVTDGSLNIGPTMVHVDVPGRDYNTKGGEYREDFQMILTEVE